MQCPHCGAEVIPGNRFCQRCRKRVVPPDSGFNSQGSSKSSPPPAPRSPSPAPQRPEPLFTGYSAVAVEIRRPGVVTLLALLNLVGGAVLLLVGGAVIFAGVASKSASSTLTTVLVGGLYLTIGLLQLATGIGLWQLRSWGRLLQISLSFLGLLGIPCGTVISILVLIYMFKPGVRILFSEKTTEELTRAEASEVARALQSSTGTVVIVASVVALLGVAMIGMIAAIAIPSLLRARVSANESAAIGSLRTIVSAEVAYSQTNGGFVDTPECLKSPGSCIPRLGASAPFLDGTTVFEAPARGYVLRFHPGPAAPAATVSEGRVSPSSLQSFAVTAAPATPMQTGIRYFCADSTGRVCSAASPVEPAGSGGCPVSCEEIR